ncbi:MAG: hypothetical protein ACRDT0_01565 [Pseudonocardiaceae bacterium]
MVMLYCGPDADDDSDEHEGYVAGQHPDGTLTGIWTDVLRCAGGDFTAYLPRCECGWSGPRFPVTAGGYAASQQCWRDEHLMPFLAGRDARAASHTQPAAIRGDLVPER